MIIKCKTEIRDGSVIYRVFEVWKGKYDPDSFHFRPPDGYITTNTWHGNEEVVDGREIIFCYIAKASDKNKLVNHSAAFPVKNDKIIYAPTSESGLRKEYNIEDFKAKILEIAKE